MCDLAQRLPKQMMCRWRTMVFINHALREWGARNVREGREAEQETLPCRETEESEYWDAQLASRAGSLIQHTVYTVGRSCVAAAGLGRHPHPRSASATLCLQWRRSSCLIQPAGGKITLRYLGKLIKLWNYRVLLSVFKKRITKGVEGMGK